MIQFVKWLCNVILCHLFYQVRFENLEILKKYPKCLLCPNHSHILDPVWIYTKVQNMHMMAKSELFKNKILGKIFRYFGAFPVRREQHDTGSTRYAIELLKGQEKCRLLIFPEGGIIKDNKKLRKVKGGAVFIAATTDLPIIPIRITVKHKIFSKVKITFKLPIQIDKDVLKDKERRREESNRLLNNIYEEVEKKVVP